MNRNSSGQSREVDMANLLTMVLEHGDDIVDDELTRGRIRSIYTQLKYGSKKTYEIAEYYNIPVQVVKDIKDGIIFRKITSDL